MACREVSIKKKKEQNIYLYYGANIKRAFILFSCGMILGGILTIYSQLHRGESLHFFTEKDLGIGAVPSFSSIFLNNIIVGMLLAMGIIWGRLLSQVILLINGVLLGIVISSYYYVQDSAKVLLSLLPHSVIEVCCLLMCASIGMSKYKKYRLADDMKLIGSIVLGYMIAAAIEVSLSYKMAQFWT